MKKCCLVVGADADSMMFAACSSAWRWGCGVAAEHGPGAATTRYNNQAAAPHRTATYRTALHHTAPHRAAPRRAALQRIMP